MKAKCETCVKKNPSYSKYWCQIKPHRPYGDCAAYFERKVSCVDQAMTWVLQNYKTLR